MELSSARGDAKFLPQYLLALIIAALLLPILLVRYVPLVDLPGHLGRLHILWNYASDPEFQQRYEVVLKPTPNLAIDFFTPLQAWLSMPDVARVFLVVMIIVFSTGCLMLSRTFQGSITPCAVLALFAAYNSLMFYGFVAYQFSCALSFIALSLWYRWHERWNPWQVAAFGLVATGVYLAHLGGFTVLALSVGFLTLIGWIHARRISWMSLIGLVPLGIPVLLYLFVRRKGVDETSMQWSSPLMKLRHALILLVGYDAAVDAAVGLALVAAVVMVLYFGRIRFHRELGLLAAFFWVIFLLSPNSFLTGTDADTRFVLPASVLTLVAVQVEIDRRAGRIAFSIAMAALLLRIAFVDWVWVRQDRLIAENVSLFEQIPRHARVYPIFTFAPESASYRISAGKFERPLYHAISWATVNRDAIVPTTFTVPGQHSVVDRKGFWFQEYLPADPAASFDAAHVFENYDVIWFFGDNEDVIRNLNEQCDLIGSSGAKSRLYRIRKQ